MTAFDPSFVYLDHNATTPICAEATKAMLPFIEQEFGNPSSGYPIGQRAKADVEKARNNVAALLGCQSHEIIFTSGGSESNNTVLKGVIDLKNLENCHIITSAIEHPAILNPALFLMELGVKITIVPVDKYGRVDPTDIQKAVLPDTKLISIMLANNETGTIQPVKEISNIAKEHGILFHTDAAQAIGKIGVDVNDLGVDFLSLAGHKLYGPKGVGALFIRDGSKLTPLIHGASQENNWRAGTENLVLVAGLGAACEVANRRLKEDKSHFMALRNRLEELLFEGIDDLVLNGHPEERLPNTLNVSVPYVEGGKILDGLPKIMASTGAACHDRSVKLSHVLVAMKISEKVGMGALRLTVGRSNSLDQIEEAATMICEQVRSM